MITLTVGTRRFEGWKRVEVTRGMDRAASSFSLTVSDKPWPVTPGDAAKVEIDGEAVITGWVDAVRAAHDSGRHDITVSGRSRTGDLVDCSAVHSPGSWTGQKIERIAAALCKPFGIDVIAETDTGAAEATFAITPAGTVHAEIEKLCRKRGVLATDDEAGRLVITRASTRRAPAILIAGNAAGSNVLAADGAFTLNGRFSRYTVAPAPIGGVPAIKAEADDPVGVGRHRPLLIRPDATADLAAARELVRHDAAVRYGRALAVTVSVAGWRANGVLWRPNRVVHYHDKWLRLNTDLLIAAVTYSLDAQGGEITRLSLIRQDAYRLLAQAGKDDSGDKWAKVVPGAPAVEVNP